MSRRHLPKIGLWENGSVPNEGSHLAISWLLGGELEVRSTSWVGVVQLSGVHIHVVPKLAGGSLAVLRMLEYAGGLDLTRELPLQRDLGPQGHDLFDLLCRLLGVEVRRLLRDGLNRDYRTSDDTLGVLRGRLRYREQYLRRFGQVFPLDCQFDEFDSDTVDNQLVATALLRARRLARSGAVRRELTLLAGVFTEACSPANHDVEWYDRTLHYTRRNERYRRTHVLSKLVLRGLAFEDLYDTSEGRVGTFLIDMNKVFESFVTRLVAKALEGTGLAVTAQSRHSAVIVDERTGETYASIVPDLIVREGTTGQCVPIDVKYKQYDQRNVSTSDVYQAFVYACALTSPDTLPRAGIIYPAAQEIAGPRLSVRPVRGPPVARILGAGLDIRSVLHALGPAGDHSQLLEQVGQMVEEITGLRRSVGGAA